MRLAKIDYDRRVRGGSFEVGDKVYLLRTIWNKEMYHKFQRHWLGPYKVIGKIGPVNYVIEFNAQRKVIHSNLLKKAHDRVRFIQEGRLVKLGQRVDKDLPGGEAQLLPKKRGRPVGSKNKPKAGTGAMSKTLLKKAKETARRRRKQAPARTQMAAVSLRRSPRNRPANQPTEDPANEAECNRLTFLLESLEQTTQRETKKRLTRRERRELKRTFQNQRRQANGHSGNNSTAQAIPERARGVLAGAAGAVGQLFRRAFA